MKIASLFFCLQRTHTLSPTLNTHTRSLFNPSPHFLNASPLSLSPCTPHSLDNPLPTAFRPAPSCHIYSLLFSILRARRLRLRRHLERLRRVLYDYLWCRHRCRRWRCEKRLWAGRMGCRWFQCGILLCSLAKLKVRERRDQPDHGRKEPDKHIEGKIFIGSAVRWVRRHR